MSVSCTTWEAQMARRHINPNKPIQPHGYAPILGFPSRDQAR